MFPHLTVEETLKLSADFFLPLTFTKEKKSRIVSDIIQELGLIKAKDTIIGDNKLRGVSGGERKRVAIATQLIVDPAVFFLDEPTSGLDSFQAQAIMECLKSLADSGRLVISVIHQPRSSIFNMFDQLLLLSEGHTTYYGPASDASAYFSNIGYSNPHLFNPADFFLDVLSPDNRTEELDKDSKARIDEISSYWKNNSLSLTKSTKENILDVTQLPEIKPIGTENSMMKSILNLNC